MLKKLIYGQFCEQNVWQNHNIKVGNNSFERVEQFKYLEQP